MLAIWTNSAIIIGLQVKQVDAARACSRLIPMLSGHLQDTLAHRIFHIANSVQVYLHVQESQWFWDFVRVYMYVLRYLTKI